MCHIFQNYNLFQLETARVMFSFLSLAPSIKIKILLHTVCFEPYKYLWASCLHSLTVSEVDKLGLCVYLSDTTIRWKMYVVYIYYIKSTTCFGPNFIGHLQVDNWKLRIVYNRAHVPTPPVINSMRDLIPTQPPHPSIKN